MGKKQIQALTGILKKTQGTLLSNPQKNSNPDSIELKTKKEAEYQYLLNIQHNRQELDQKLQASTIPKRYRGVQFKDLNVQNEEIHTAVKTAKAYISNFKTALDRGASGFFAGNVGTGKTTLACMITEGVIRNGYQAQYATAWNLIQDIRTAYKDPSSSLKSMVTKYINLQLLVIDEIGVQYGTDDERVLLYQVINGRYNQVKPIIIIFNSRNPVEDGSIDSRSIDRLKEGGGFSFFFTGKSFRH